MSDTLPVGDELKRLIHQYIFDKPIFTDEYMRSVALKVWETQPSCIWFHEGFDAWREYKDEGYEVHVEQKFHDYLTGNGMLLIVEKMKEEGWGWTANAHGNVTSWLFYRPEIGIADSGKSATHEHAPTTTAYAALRALKVIK